MMDKYPFLQLQIKHCRIEVSVNDIVVSRKNIPDIVTVARAMPEYLINGNNTLAVKVRPFDGKKYDSGSMLILRLARFAEGELMAIDGGDELAAIYFEPQALKDELAADGSWQFEANFVYKESPKVWAWEKAEKLSLTPNFIADLNQFVGAIRRDFSNRQSSRIIEFEKELMEEKAICYPEETVDLQVADLKEYLAGDEGGEPIKLVNVAAEDIAYRLAANGRLVECVGRDGLPLIRTKVDNLDNPAGSDWQSLAMHVGLLDGKLRILR